MRIGFDLDGVLYDFVACARKACDLEYQFLAASGDFDADAEVWDFYKHQWGLTDDEFWRAVRNHPDTFNSQPLAPQWRTTLGTLKARGHSLHVVTARSMHRVNTLAWIEEHLTGVFDSIHFTADKSTVQLDVLIDDSPDNLAQLYRHPQRPTWLVCYDQPYNRDTWECNYRAHDPVHLYDIMLKIEEQFDIRSNPPTETVLEEAQRLVYGDRGEDYGHPIEDFTRTGRIWAAILGIEHVAPEEVALCMIGVKMSREVNKAKRDNATDIAGYAGTLAMVREAQARG